MILTKINNLNPNKSFGLEVIHPMLLKELSDFILYQTSLYVDGEWFNIIMNSSLWSWILPNDWKWALQKGPKNIPTNYHPVVWLKIFTNNMMMSILKKKLIMSHNITNENLPQTILSPFCQRFIWNVSVCRWNETNGEGQIAWRWLSSPKRIWWNAKVVQWLVIKIPSRQKIMYINLGDIS